MGKLLGVFLDENLSWGAHIKSISRKISSGIGALKRIRPYVPLSLLETIYKSIVQPHFDYCSPVWDNCSQGMLNKLQKLQNRAARIITHSSYDIPSSEVLDKLKWERITERQTKTRCILMYKILNGLQPEYLRDQFVYRSDVTQTCFKLRDTINKLALPLPRTDYLKKSLR